MENPDDIWLNSTVHLPAAAGIAVILLILILSLWNTRLGVLLLLATVPLQRFIVIPGILGDRFTPHEVAFLSFIASALIRRGSGIKLTPPWTGPLSVPVLCLLFVGVVSLLGNQFAQHGLAELVIIGYLYLLMHVVVDFSNTPQNALYAFRAWYLTSAVFSVLAAYGGILHFAGLDSFFMLGPRLLVTFFNPNQAGSFILAGAFMFLARASHPSTPQIRKIANLALLFGAIIGGYFIQSRATVLGAGVGLIVFLVLRRVRLGAIIAVAAMLLAGRLALSQFQKSDEKSAEIYDQRYSEGIDPESQSAQVRIENWQTGIDAFASSPLVGIGIGTLWLQARPSASGETYQVHNTYLSFLGETGLLGFLALFAIVVVLVRSSLAGIRDARGTEYEHTLSALIPALSALGVFNVFHYGIRARHLWVTMALILAFRRLASQEHSKVALSEKQRVLGTLKKNSGLVT